MPEFAYSDLLPLGEDTTPYRLVTSEGVSTFEADGRTFLKVEPEALRKLAAEAIHDIQHYLRPAHLAQLRRIVDDPEASPNDRFVATDLHAGNIALSPSGKQLTSTSPLPADTVVPDLDVPARRAPAPDDALAATPTVMPLYCTSPPVDSPVTASRKMTSATASGVKNPSFSA